MVAALSVGRSDDLEHARRFITERKRAGRGALADVGTDLERALARVGLLGSRDSNPDNQLQRLASCH